MGKPTIKAGNGRPPGRVSMAPMAMLDDRGSMVITAPKKALTPTYPYRIYKLYGQLLLEIEVDHFSPEISRVGDLTKC